MIKFSFFHLALVIMFFLNGCSDSGQNVDVEVQSDGEQISKCPPKNETKLPPSNIQGVNVYMEVSGSMKGFMPPSANTTDFQILIPDFLSRLNRDLVGFHFYALAQEGQPIKKFTLDAAKYNVAYGKFSFGKSSTLPVMFDSILSNIQAGSISILITDAIYSPAKGMEKIKTQAITDISDRMTKALKQNYSVACFSFKSNFNTVNSPFYFFIIGAPQNINVIKDKINQSLNTLSGNLKNTSFNEFSFGYPLLTPYYSIIPYVDNNGTGEPVECREWESRYLAMENVSIKNGPEFWIGFNINGIPNYAQQKNYLENNLEISGLGLKASKIGQILTKEQFGSKIEDSEDKRVSEKCTHYVRVKINEMEPKTGEIYLSLKKVNPEWINSYSHNDSQNAEVIRDKTFGLDNIYAGIADAYRDKETGYFFKGAKLIVTKK
jgi:hypothetical protein